MGSVWENLSHDIELSVRERWEKDTQKTHRKGNAPGKCQNPHDFWICLEHFGTKPYLKIRYLANKSEDPDHLKANTPRN